jgi:hypothetical protein
MLVRLLYIDAPTGDRMRENARAMPRVFESAVISTF